MSITRFNTNVVNFTFEPKENFTYKTLEELYKENGKSKIYVVKGLFISNKSRYGESAICVNENHFTNLPNHLINTVKEIRQDTQLVADINNNKVGFTIYEYVQEQYNKTCYSVNWVDL